MVWPTKFPVELRLVRCKGQECRSGPPSSEPCLLLSNSLFHGDFGLLEVSVEPKEGTFLFSAMDTTVSCLSLRSCWSFKAGKLLAFPVKAAVHAEPTGSMQCSTPSSQCSRSLHGSCRTIKEKSCLCSRTMFHTQTVGAADAPLKPQCSPAARHHRALITSKDCKSVTK